MLRKATCGRISSAAHVNWTKCLHTDAMWVTRDAGRGTVADAKAFVCPEPASVTYAHARVC